MQSSDDSFSMRVRVFKHTYLYGPKVLFTSVIKDEDFNRVLDMKPARPRSLISRVLARTLWFWPRIEDARGWVVSTNGTRWDPEIYLHDHRTKLIEQVLERTSVGHSLMELGCNCGSDMAQLYSYGFRNLMGVDASGTALKLFARQYPNTFDHVHPKHDLFQRYLLKQADKSVDFIYSNGATIELVHPSFPIVAQMCRVARRGILLDLSERQQGYPRDYTAQMQKQGFSLTYTDKPTRPTDKSHIFVFLSRS